MNKEEFLKAIIELPKIETDNPISIMNSVNVDDLMSAIDRLNKVPDYNDLLKENQELKKQVEEYENELEKADSITQSCIFNGKKESEISYRKCLNMLEKHKNQQKKFIEYLENEIKRLEKTEFYIDSIQKAAIETHKHNLSKYKEIIGDINDKK